MRTPRSTASASTPSLRCASCQLLLVSGTRNASSTTPAAFGAKGCKHMPTTRKRSTETTWRLYAASDDVVFWKGAMSPKILFSWEGEVSQVQQGTRMRSTY